jgi:hypothetical protein
LIGGTAEEYAFEGHQRQAVSGKIFRPPLLSPNALISSPISFVLTVTTLHLRQPGLTVARGLH